MFYFNFFFPLLKLLSKQYRRKRSYCAATVKPTVSAVHRLVIVLGNYSTVAAHSIWGHRQWVLWSLYIIIRGLKRVCVKFTHTLTVGVHYIIIRRYTFIRRNIVENWSMNSFNLYVLCEAVVQYSGTYLEKKFRQYRK